MAKKRKRTRSASLQLLLERPTVLWWGLGILFFLFLTAQAGGSDLHVAVGAVIIFLLLTVGQGTSLHLRERLCIPVLAVLAYLLLNAAASLYSNFGSFAGREFSKILSAFCVYGVALLRLRKEDAPRLAAMVAGASATFSLLSIDAAAGKFLSTPFFYLADTLGCRFSTMPTGYETGVRITGIFGNANVLGGILALGVLLSFYLVQVTRDKKSRYGACMLLGINTLGFLLAFSMGAIAMFLVAILIYFLFSAKGTRLSLFLLMAEDALVSIAMLFVAFPGLGCSGWKGIIPLFAALACGGVVYALHRWAVLPLYTYLNVHRLATGVTIGTLSLLAILYVVLGYQITGPATLSASESMRRSVYPAPGFYTLEGKWSGEIRVQVESQNSAQTITHTSSMLYNDVLDSASFTVPEDAKVIYLTFQSETGAALENVTLSDGTNIPLHYNLLPGFVANRIQGLWANQNAIQRTEFFRDGLKLYAKSPVIGNGLGSVEGLVTSVQSFYYESRYVHNHYIQLLAEMGVPGLLAFLTILIGSVITLVRRRKEGGATDPFLPVIAACLAMMALHAAVEAVWSISAYQSVTLLLLASLAVCYGRPLAQLNHTAVGWIGLIAIWLFVIVFGWFLFRNIDATDEYAQIKAGLREQGPYTMTNLAKQDRYNWAQYKLDMAVNAATSEVPQFRDTAVRYAKELRKLRTHSINADLERYHYAALGQYEELFVASREGIVQKASVAETWQEEFDIYEDIFPQSDDEKQRTQPLSWYCEQVLLTYQQLLNYNQNRFEQIRLSPRNATFLGKILVWNESQTAGAQSASNWGAVLFDSTCAADVDGDGVPDLLSGVHAGEDGFTTNSKTLDLSFYSSQPELLQLQLETVNPNSVTSVMLDGIELALATGQGTVTVQIPIEQLGDHALTVQTAPGTVFTAITLQK